MESRKQAVSIRMNASDVRKIKRLAERLGVRDSDIVRFAVKSMLSNLAPLHDPLTRGKSLMPVFLDHGHELAQHFDLDAARLESIINADAAVDSQVDRQDIQLLAMNGFGRPYLRWSLEPRMHAAAARNVKAKPVPDSPRGAPSRAETANGNAMRHEPDDVSRSLSLRAYFFKKYLYDDGNPG